ncbi:MAG: NAD(P)H-quinone oxidoreductase [Candidatus Obscuribacterales bacterium]|nr:NAD(P)H-quinone oxidoreductase [Candidatus Obscuribacterales bacterium]
MRAVVIKQSGGPEVLTLSDVPEILPAKGEVRIKIKACGVNRADVLQRMGHYPSPADSPPDIPGLEYAGVVDALGAGVEGLAVGDRVFGLAGGGTYAEAVLVNARTVAPIPENLSFVEAASVPEAFVTAYDAMVSQCMLQQGESVLVHAVGSGVGLAAVQIANLIGAKTIGTARNADKIKEAKKFGLQDGIVVEHHQFAHAVKDLTSGHGVDVVMELVGGHYLAEDIHCAANKGRIIVVGLVGGLRCEVDLGIILKKRLLIKGTTLRMRPLEEKILAAQVLSKNLAPLFAKGLLTPNIHHVLPWEKAGEAHQIMESNKNTGKIVLEIA